MLDLDLSLSLSLLSSSYLLCYCLMEWACIQCDKRRSATTRSASGGEERAATDYALPPEESSTQIGSEELDIIKLNEVKVFCDNQSCIKLAIKHIRARHHFIREFVEAKEFSLHYTSTTTMWADFLTKPVPQQKHWNCCNKIGLSINKINKEK